MSAQTFQFRSARVRTAGIDHVVQQQLAYAMRLQAEREARWSLLARWWRHVLAGGLWLLLYWLSPNVTYGGVAVLGGLAIVAAFYWGWQIGSLACSKARW